MMSPILKAERVAGLLLTDSSAIVDTPSANMENPSATSIAGQFSVIGVLTGSLPRDRFFVSAFYDGPANTWMQGLDIGAVVHWIGQYEDDNVTLTGSPKLNMPRTGGPEDKAAPFPQRARKVADWTTLDLIASYTFNLPPPAPAEVPYDRTSGI